MNIQHQYDCKGNHRIVIDGEAGLPTMYEHVAFAKGKDEDWYMAVTPYYEGVIPHEMTQGVFQFTRAGDDTKDAVAYNFHSPEEPCPWLNKPDSERSCPIGTCPQQKGEQDGSGI